MWNLLCQYIIYIYIYIKGKKSTNGRLKKKKKPIATVLLGTVAIVQNFKKKKKSGSINQNGTVEALPLFI